MKKRRNYLGIMFIFLIISRVALSEEVQLGEPTHGGNGCPSNSAIVKVNKKDNSFNIEFHGFEVQKKGASLERVSRKSCNIAIPIQVPKGYSISLAPLDLSGSVSLPEGTQADLSVTSFLPGQSGKMIKKEFTGAMKEPFIITVPSKESEETWSACGVDTILRLNVAILLKQASPQTSKLEISPSDTAKISVAEAVPHSRNSPMIKTRRCS